MKVEDIKLAFEANVQFLSNVSELKNLQKNIQTEYSDLSGNINLVNELQKFANKSDKLLTSIVNADNEVEKFIGEFKKLGVDAPKEVLSTLEGIRNAKTLVNKQRELIISAAKSI